MNLRALPLLLLLALAACKEDPVAPAGNGTTVPAPGSTFTYRDQAWLPDATPVSDTTITESVIRTGQSFAGKNDVLMAASDDAVTYLHYESNGDYSYGYMDGTWDLHPIGSRGKVTIAPRRDTSGSMITLRSGTIEYKGHDTIWLGTAIPLPVEQTETNLTYVDDINGEITTTTYRINISFSRKIGYIVRWDSYMSEVNAANNTVAGEHFLRTLQSYSLK